MNPNSFSKMLGNVEPLILLNYKSIYTPTANSHKKNQNQKNDWIEFFLLF